jgi:diguanylate cyclase (GGDEF)-like protein
MSVRTARRDERVRLDALRSYGLVDASPDAVLDGLVALAADICRTRYAAIAFVDETHERVKAAHGWHPGTSLRTKSLSGVALRALLDAPDPDEATFLVPDTTALPTTCSLPCVVGAPQIRFALAVPLRSAEGQLLGVLSVTDPHTHLVDTDRLARLQEIARQVMALLDLRRRNRELEAAVQDRSRAEQLARFQANHDSLTGLPNRNLFVERMREVLERHQARTHRRRGASAAMLFIDLDRFKRINDTLGHAYGDILLREVAARFTGCLRPDETLARLAGDEFGVLLPDIHGAAYAASVSQMLLRALRRPVVLGDAQVHVDASIGIALFPRDGTNPETLIKHADVAMYEAKKTGGYQAFSRRMNADGYQRLIEEEDLRRAIARGEVTVCYQPEIDLVTGSVAGVEALARWEHPTRGPIPPEHFISLAEQVDLIVPLGDLVLRQACAGAAHWRARGHEDLRVAVNLSPRQLARPQLAERIAEILAESGLPGDALDLELTETTLATGGDSTPQTLQALRQQGIRLFVDDFGTGYSSLAYLRNFTVDAIKIDKAFIAGLGKATPDEALIKALIEMACALHLKVVAEGVENRTQLEHLRRLGCHIGQGYFFSRPLSFDSLLILMEGHQQRRAKTVAALAAV